VHSTMARVNTQLPCKAYTTNRQAIPALIQLVLCSRHGQHCRRWLAHLAPVSQLREHLLQLRHAQVGFQQDDRPARSVQDSHKTRPDSSTLSTTAGWHGTEQLFNCMLPLSSWQQSDAAHLWSPVAKSCSAYAACLTAAGDMMRIASSQRTKSFFQTPLHAHCDMLLRDVLAIHLHNHMNSTVQHKCNLS
jgi:hypothetical protein